MHTALCSSKKWVRGQPSLNSPACLVSTSLTTHLLYCTWTRNCCHLTPAMGPSSTAKIRGPLKMCLLLLCLPEPHSKPKEVAYENPGKETRPSWLDDHWSWPQGCSEQYSSSLSSLLSSHSHCQCHHLMDQGPIAFLTFINQTLPSYTVLVSMG